MKPSIRTYLCNDENQRFFGEGPRQLLHAIDETGSLRSAALSMNMAYTKALRIIRSAEATLGFPLTVRTTGGKGGGGSQMTSEAREFLAKYEAYRDACTSGQQLYEEFLQAEICFSSSETQTPSFTCSQIQTMSGSPASSAASGLENVSARTSSWLRSTVLRSSTPVLDVTGSVPLFADRLVVTRSRRFTITVNPRDSGADSYTSQSERGALPGTYTHVKGTGFIRLSLCTRRSAASASTDTGTDMPALSRMQNITRSLKICFPRF